MWTFVQILCHFIWDEYLWIVVSQEGYHQPWEVIICTQRYFHTYVYIYIMLHSAVPDFLHSCWEFQCRSLCLLSLPSEPFPYPTIDAFQKLPLTLTQLRFMTPRNNFRATQKCIIHGAGEMTHWLRIHIALAEDLSSVLVSTSSDS